MNKNELEKKIEILVEQGMDEFWDVIHKAFPDVKTGDLDIATTTMMYETMEKAVWVWLWSNASNDVRESLDKN